MHIGIVFLMATVQMMSILKHWIFLGWKNVNLESVQQEGNTQLYVCEHTPLCLN